MRHIVAQDSPYWTFMEIVLRLFVRFCICEISKELRSGLLFYLRFGRGKVSVGGFRMWYIQGLFDLRRVSFPATRKLSSTNVLARSATNRLQMSTPFGSISNKSAQI